MPTDPLRRLPHALALAIALTSAALAQPPRPRPTLHHVAPCGGRVGSTVEVVVDGEALDAADSLWFSHPGLTATRLEGRSKAFRVAIDPGVTPGNHDVRALTPDGVTNPRTFVVGSRPEAVEVEPNDTKATANPIAVNSVVNGSIGVADIDAFGFVGKAGQRVFVDLAAERVESKLDATVRLLDARGRELAESRDVFGADPFLDVTLPADGRYFVKVHDVTYGGSADHFYRLTLDDGPHLDAAFPAIAELGKPAHEYLIGRNLGGTPLPLRIDGRPVEGKDWDGIPRFLPTPELPFNALGVTATLRGFPVRFAADRGASNAVFVVESGTPIVSEREPNAPASPQTIVPPCSIAGDFRTRSDIDVYRFVGRKGEVWRIEAIAEGIGSAADPSFVVQRVKDQGDREFLATADDTADPGLAPRFNLASVDAGHRFSVPGDGVYEVVLSDVAGSSRGDPRLSYNLAIRRERPDFHLFVVPAAVNTLDAVTVRRGGRAGAVVLAWRHDGFAGAIRVRAVGLPEGLRSEPVVIPAGATSAPIVFDAVDATGPGVGIVRLVGEAIGAEPGSREALPREAIPGTIIWPPRRVGNVQVTVAPARATRGFVVAVREGSPFLLSVKPRRQVVAQGQELDLEVSVQRRPGCDEAVTLAGWDTPAGFLASEATIPKGQSSAILKWPVAVTLTPGTYSLVLKGSGIYQPDPALAARYRVDEPSNPALVTIRPRPMNLALVADRSSIKPGLTASVGFKIERIGVFVGPVSMTVSAPPSAKLTAEPLLLAPDRSSGSIVLRAAGDSPIGGPIGLTLRAEAVVNGEAIEVAVPMNVSIVKP